MIKKLSIFLIAVLMVAPLMAQPEARSGSALYGPRKGQFQVNMVLGSGLFYPEQISMKLLPSYNPVAEMDGNIAMGLLKLGSLNSNSIVNCAGIQGKIFLSKHWAIHGMFSMDIQSTPERDYQEGTSIEGLKSISYEKILGEGFSGATELTVGGLAYMEGKLTHNYIGVVGTDYYFNNCNGRLYPYLGLAGGFQHARIQTILPYTGIEVETTNEVVPEGQEKALDPIEIYLSTKRAGEAYSISGALVAGVEYNLLPGLNIAIEVRPFNYYYSVARIYRDGYEWNGHTHQFKFFAFPQLKLGFRF